MTTHAFRPAGAAPRPRAGPRGGRTSASTNPRGAARTVLVAASVGTLLGLGPAPASAQPELRSTIALTSNRDRLDLEALGAEIYLINPDGTLPRRLTDNADGDAFPVSSPDGKWIVFDSNRLSRTAGVPLNTGDLFLMKSDGTEQRLLTRGSSASWSPDGNRLAFHASASGTGQPVNATPGPPTCDSDLFVANVDDLLDLGKGRTNLTNSPLHLDYDADWSPDGTKIAFVRYPKSKSNCPTGTDPPNPREAEIYVINADGTGEPTPLTFPVYNPDDGSIISGGKAAPDWSPDGARIAFMCRPGPTTLADLCVMNADGSNRTKLTNTAGVFEGTPSWSPDGKKLLFSRQLGAGQQLWVMCVPSPLPVRPAAP